MKPLLLLGLWLAGVVAVEAAHVKLLSPDTAQTFAVGSLDDHNFTWNARTGQFGAVLQFSNRPATKWREEEACRINARMTSLNGLLRGCEVFPHENVNISVVLRIMHDYLLLC